MALQNIDSNVPIIDIRCGKSEDSLLDEVYEKLKPSDEFEKVLPTMILYDEKGLKLFEEITYLEEYYLTNAEIEVLRNHAYKIADSIPSGSQMLELGSGYVSSFIDFLRLNLLDNGAVPFACCKTLI